MYLSELGNYDVCDDEERYYSEGYHIADLIAMHSVLCHLEGVEADYDFDLESYQSLAFVDDGEERSVVKYNPFLITIDTGSNELLYIVAHELTHVKNDDVKKLNAKPFYFGIGILSTLITLLCIGLSQIVCLIALPSYYLFRAFDSLVSREIETEADLGALEYASVYTIMNRIEDSQPNNRFGWIMQNNTTTKRFTKWYNKEMERK